MNRLFWRDSSIAMVVLAASEALGYQLYAIHFAQRRGFLPMPMMWGIAGFLVLVFASVLAIFVVALLLFGWWAFEDRYVS